MSLNAAPGASMTPLMTLDTLWTFREQVAELTSLAIIVGTHGPCVRVTH